MSLDFRYHVVSLTAVFGALLIGILLGVAVKEGPGMSQQITDLTKEFQRSQVLKDIDRKTNQFNERTQPLLVHNRLTGRNIALVIDSATFPDDKIEAVRETLTAAGAQIPMEITFKSALAQLTPDQITALDSRLGVAPSDASSIDGVMRLAAQDMGSPISPTLTTLSNQKLIRTSGDLSTPVSIVILLGGAKDDPQDSVTNLDVPFMRGCADHGLRIAATETLEMPSSAISAYQKVAPLTIDNIDHAAGRIALVLALSNNLPGNFGYKSTAGDVAPEVE